MVKSSSTHKIHEKSRFKIWKPRISTQKIWPQSALLSIFKSKVVLKFNWTTNLLKCTKQWRPKRFSSLSWPSLSADCLLPNQRRAHDHLLFENWMVVWKWCERKERMMGHRHLELQNRNQLVRSLTIYSFIYPPLSTTIIYLFAAFQIPNCPMTTDQAMETKWQSVRNEMDRITKD